MMHCGHYRRDRATVDSERQFNWPGVVGLPLDSGGAAALHQST